MKDLLIRKLRALGQHHQKAYNTFIDEIDTHLPVNFTNKQLEYIKCRLHLDNNFMGSNIDSIIQEVKDAKDEE